MVLLAPDAFLNLRKFQPMFSNISWQEYWTSLVVITLVYYLVIYLVYFRKGLQLSSQKEVFNSETSGKEERQPTLFEVDDPGFKEAETESEEHIIQACMDGLNAFFENSKKSKAVKSEMMFVLHSLLQKYPSLKNSEYRQSMVAKYREGIFSSHEGNGSR